MGRRGPAILPAEKRGVNFHIFNIFHKQGGLKAALFFLSLHALEGELQVCHHKLNTLILRELSTGAQ